MKDEMLAQLFIHIIDEIPAKALVKKLASGELY